MVGFTTKGDKDQSVRLTVLLVPGGRLGAVPPVKPLASWKP
jgi:hypothetical protein